MSMIREESYAFFTSNLSTIGKGLMTFTYLCLRTLYMLHIRVVLEKMLIDYRRQTTDDARQWMPA